MRMVHYILKYAFVSMGIGSGIYCLNIVLGDIPGNAADILSIWGICILLGIVASFYHTRVPDLYVSIGQFVVAVVGFTTFAVVSGYVTLDIVAILIYALLTFVVVSIIFIIQYWFARVNAASINKKLNEIRN